MVLKTDKQAAFLWRTQWESCLITLCTSDEDNAAVARIHNLFHWRKRRSCPEPNMVINTSPCSTVIMLTAYMCASMLFIPIPYLSTCRNNEYVLCLNTSKWLLYSEDYSFSVGAVWSLLINTHTYRDHSFTYICKHIVHTRLCKDAVLQTNACNKTAHIHTFRIHTRWIRVVLLYRSIQRANLVHRQWKAEVSDLDGVWGNEGQSSLAAAEPQTIPLGTQLKSLGDRHVAEP